MKESPYFSVIIPTYNRADLIKKTISSFLDQTFQNYEIIVVDNDSTDHTEEVVRGFGDERISYFKKQNEEQAIARNFGAKKSVGGYINFFDSDDLAYPNHLQAAYDFIQHNRNVEVFHQNYEIKNSDGTIARDPTPIHNINRQLVNGNLLAVNGVFLKRDIALQYPFPEDRKIVGSEDYFLWLKIAAAYPILSNPLYTSASLQHAQRSILNYPKEKIVLRKELMLKYVLQDDSIIRYYGKSISRLKSTTYFYIALHLTMLGFKKNTIHYVQKGLRETPGFIFTKRFFTILRYFLKAQTQPE